MTSMTTTTGPVRRHWNEFRLRLFECKIKYYHLSLFYIFIVYLRLTGNEYIIIFSFFIPFRIVFFFLNSKITLDSLHTIAALKTTQYKCN